MTPVRFVKIKEIVDLKVIAIHKQDAILRTIKKITKILIFLNSKNSSTVFLQIKGTRNMSVAVEVTITILKPLTEDVVGDANMNTKMDVVEDIRTKIMLLIMNTLKESAEDIITNKKVADILININMEVVDIIMSTIMLPIIINMEGVDIIMNTIMLPIIINMEVVDIIIMEVKRVKLICQKLKNRKQRRKTSH